MSAKAAYRRCALVWIALMALLALTCGSAFVHLGAWNGVVNLAIAAIKVLLVALFFMHLDSGSALIRIYAATALFALSLLFSLSLGDYATRTLHTAPFQTPHQAPPHAAALR